MKESYTFLLRNKVSNTSITITTKAATTNNALAVLAIKLLAEYNLDFTAVEILDVAHAPTDE